MAVKIGFDESHNVLQPTFVLATRSGKKLGHIPAHSISFSDNLVTYSELSFQVHKNDCSETVWKNLKDLKLLWYKEANAWFELRAPITDDAEVIKDCTAMSLGVAELSQINLYDIEINTEDDIARDDYIPTVLYDPANPQGSLLQRITEKAPHYTIAYVDASIRKMQRTFTFDGKTIYDAFQEIAEEIKCLFDIRCYSNAEGKLMREIYVFDLQSHCLDCGYRGDFVDECPNCHSHNISEGVGEDTTIFVSSDSLGQNIQYSCDVDSVKNCFKLEAGDDLMTATVINCNPNGSPYIWYFSDEMLDDMPAELVQKIREYQEKYQYYQTQFKAPVGADLVSRYNTLVDKYASYDEDLGKIPAEIVGYPALMQAYYDTIDMDLFLEHNLMPDVKHQDTTAALEAAKLTRNNLSPLAVTSLERVSAATAASTALSMAKVIVDYRYRVKVNDGYTLTDKTWKGSFTVTNYSDDEDTAVSAEISITLTDDYETYLRQKIEKAIDDEDLYEDVYDIEDIFKLDNARFAEEMKKYCLNRLTSFHDACEACLSVLIQNGAADMTTWGTGISSVYDTLYTPYREKLGIIEAEMKAREDEIAIVMGVYDNNSNLQSPGIQTELIDIISDIADELDFEKFLGEDLWKIFASYRREDTYSNDNYISDGLDNKTIFQNAIEFLDTAQKDIIKSATMQHTISATLKNLLVMKGFAPIVDHFAVGNWIRVRVDEDIYKLRLTGYTITWDELSTLNVTFSDVIENGQGIFDADTLVKQMQAVSSSYEAVERQASNGQNSADALQHWSKNGFEVDNMSIMNNAKEQDVKWDSNGIWLREFMTEFGDYDDRQLRIINRGLFLTDDGWITSKAAIGNFYYRNPKTGLIESRYGVNGELIVGQLILGNELGIYTANNTLTFDDDGLRITNGINVFSVNPNSDNLMVLEHAEEKIMWVDEHGMLHLRGDGAGLDLTMNNSVTKMQASITANAEAITAEVSRAQGAEGELSSSITQTATDIRAEVKDTTDKMQASITANAEAITAEVSRATGAESTIRQTADKINWLVKSSSSASSVELTDSAMQFISKNITISGYVTFYDLEHTGGSTKINGGNITTGTIDALRVTIAGTYGGFTQGEGMTRYKDGSTEATTGIVMYGPNGDGATPYFMVSNKGARMQGSASTSIWCVNGRIGLNGGAVVLSDGYGLAFGDSNPNVTTAYYAVYKSGNNMYLGNTGYPVTVRGSTLTAEVTTEVSGFVGKKELWSNSNGNSSGTYNDSSAFRLYIIIGTPSSGGTRMSLVVPREMIGYTFQIADESNFSRFTINGGSFSRSAGTGVIYGVYGIR